MVHPRLERHEDGLRMHPAQVHDPHEGDGAGEAEREPPRRGARIEALLDVLMARGREHDVDSLARDDLSDPVKGIAGLDHAACLEVFASLSSTSPQGTETTGRLH